MNATPVSPARASFMLVLVTFVWAFSFPMTKHWQDLSNADGVDKLLSSLTLIGLRMPLALALLLLWQPRLARQITREEFYAGLVLGGLFWFGFVLQTWGLAFTTPALSGFFTALCSAWVPPLAYVAFRERVAPLTLVGIVVAVAGCAVLVDNWTVGPGESLTVAASVVFAIQMLVLDRLGKRLRSEFFSVGFLTATGGLSLIGGFALSAARGDVAGWLTWTAARATTPATLGVVVGLATFPTVLGFHWMNTYQPHVPSSRAALIYLLESVFTAMVSAALGFDEVTLVLVLGGVLILVGNLLVELPGMLKAKETAPPTSPPTPT